MVGGWGEGVFWPKMMTSSELDLAGVVGQVTPDGTLLQAWPLVGGISAAMMALEMREANGRVSRLVVRRHRYVGSETNARALSREFRLLKALGEAGLAVPVVRGLDVSGRILVEPYLVLEYVEGEPLFAPADLDGFLGHLAGQLAAIQVIDVGALGLDFLPGQADECIELGRARPAGVKYALDDGCIRPALGAHGRPLARNPAGLLHGDYWPGNVLWREGRPAAVIDWEDAMTGDPLLDLAITRLDVGWIFGLEAMETFTRTYRSLVAIDCGDLAYWDLCAALRLVRLVGDDLAGWVGYFEGFGRGDISEESLRGDFAAFAGRALRKLSSS